MSHFKIVFLTSLSLALVFELFNTISVPITSHLFISEYNGYKFGVFGWCKVDGSICSPIRMGYSLDDILLFNDNEYLHLPNHAKYALSKLLLVHVLSFVCVLVFWLFAILICIKWLNTSKSVLLFAVGWSMVTFMVSLLGFLIDVLMFASHVTWSSWLMLVSAFFVALSGILLCLMIRDLSYRRFVKLQGEVDVCVPMTEPRDPDELNEIWKKKTSKTEIL